MAAVSSDDEFHNQLSQAELMKLAEEESATLLRGVTYTDEDGTVMEWDYERKAYFPKIDTYQIAQYQILYGVGACREDGSQSREENKEAQYHDYWNYYRACCQDQLPLPEVHIEDLSEDEPGLMEQPKKKFKRQTCKDWHEADPESTKQAYVTGLPPDMAVMEFRKIMSKYGVIQMDSVTSLPKVKLYRDQAGNLKGDGLCTYIRPESVTLAAQMLDGVDIRGYTIHVDRAKFQLKGTFDPIKQENKRKNKMKHKYRDTHQM
ncbi:hypothetical protein BsWGS_28052 [Bradybaena similaris]